MLHTYEKNPPRTTCVFNLIINTFVPQTLCNVKYDYKGIKMELCCFLYLYKIYVVNC